MLNIRNPWGAFEWGGAWSDNSPLWTHEIRQQLQPILNGDDGQFWMSFEDFLSHFDSATVCKVRKWEEVRTRGCFMRLTQGEAGWMSGPMDSVASKWFYRLDVTRKEG